MSLNSQQRRPRSASPTTSHHSHHRRHHGSDKHHPFAMDLLKTAVTALGEAIITGRNDGHHHQHQHHYDDHDSRGIVAPDNKTADQVYDTLLQAAYTLGEVVGDFERKLGIRKGSDEEEEEGGYERRLRTEKHGNRSRDTTTGYDYGYDYGTAAPLPPGGYRYYPQDPYTTEQRPYPLRRASSNPGPPSRRSSRRSQNKSAKPPPCNQSRSPSPSSSSSHSSKSKKKAKEERKPKSKEEILLHNLPGLITRAAFILELLELNQKHREGTGMAAKYAALAMGLKLVKQARREYRAMSERRERKGK